MNNKLYVFILNNKSEAAIVPRPKQFGYPPSLTIGSKTYYNSNRLRYSTEVPNGEAMIYTEKNCRLDLSKFEGQKPEPEEPEFKPVNNEPRMFGVHVTSKEFGYVEVEATSEDEAIEKAQEAVDNNEVQPDGDDDIEFDVEELDNE